MQKRNLTIPIVFLILSVIIVLGCTWLVYHWQTDPEAICNGAGGWWGPVGCENLCDKTKAGYDCTEPPFHMDCTCGRYKDMCWNGKQCVSR